MVPALGILQTFGQVEVGQTDGVYWIEMKVPIATTLCLFVYGERRIIYSAVLEELMVYILHLHNELLSLVVLAINIEDGTASINSVAKLF